MSTRVMVLVGTRKGPFIFESGADRTSWKMSGPFCETWPINHVVGDEQDGTIYAGGGSEWFGPAVWKTRDFGRTWTRSKTGLSYPEGAQPVKAVWSLAVGREGLHVGVEPAGLFRSLDGGETFAHLDALHSHPTRDRWNPGGAGLILHSIVVDRKDPDRMWVGISAAGVFHSADAGQTWEPRNTGTRADFMPDDDKYPDVGQCVHNIVAAPGMSDRLYQQNHCGMYRSDDGGRQWLSIEAGLPSSFGFPAAAHPTDPETLYLLPLNGDIAGRYMPGASAAVWRTRDAGASWQAMREGLPQTGAYFGVLRQALATDRLKPAGVYFGSSSGSLYASADEGDSWSPIAQHLPTITSVETLVIES